MIPRQTLTVKRVAAGSYVLGIYQEGAESEFTIRASVQPLKANEMELLPDERRQSEAYRLYTDTPLQTAKEGKKGSPETVNADKVIIYGDTFEVYSVGTWQNQIINHYKIIVFKI
ncbi:MAG: hypothetical protein KAU20_02510 [Nanoarchaeota archaeon]|nr:hypothetical protein [Nanoarchaeota archaeon]